LLFLLFLIHLHDEMMINSDISCQKETPLAGRRADDAIGGGVIG
jgi:hypothetical protein